MQVPLVVVCPTHDGGGPHVPLLREHSWCTREQWWAVILEKQGVQSISVFTTSLSSLQPQLDYNINVQLYTEWNTAPQAHLLPSPTCSTMKYLALYATLHLAAPNHHTWENRLSLFMDQGVPRLLHDNSKVH